MVTKTYLKTTYLPTYVSVVTVLTVVTVVTIVKVVKVVTVKTEVTVVTQKFTQYLFPQKVLFIRNFSYQKKLKMLQHLKPQNLTKLKNSKCDITKINKKCDKMQIVKKKKSKTQIVTKLNKSK